MQEETYRATIAAGLEDLIPRYMANRRKELDALEAALLSTDLEQVWQLAHAMKGIGSTYGFARITELGAGIQKAAQIRDFDALSTYVALYREYLARVEITFA